MKHSSPIAFLVTRAVESFTLLHVTLGFFMLLQVGGRGRKKAVASWLSLNPSKRVDLKCMSTV